jgi:sugar phosphate permease
MAKGLEKTLRYRWLIFGVLALQFLLVYFHRVSTAVVAQDLMKDFLISGTALGILSSGYFYTYAVMQLPIGVLADSWGPRKTIAFFGFVAALGSISFGFSPSFSIATFSRIVVGFGVSAVFVCSMKIFSMWFKGNEYARISGIFLALGGIGWLLAATPLVVLSQLYGWRMVFIATGCITTLISFLSVLIVVDSPEKRGYSTIRNQDVSQTTARAALLQSLIIVLREKQFWPLASWSFINGGILFGFFGLWAGPFLSDVYMLSKGTMGNILSMVAWAMILGCPLLGYLSDKIIHTRKGLIFVSSLVHSLCWLIVLLSFRSFNNLALYMFFFILGITSSAIPVALIAATRELFPVKIAGISQGLMNLFPFFGGVVFQPLIGYILDRTGKTEGVYPAMAYNNAFLFLLLAGLISIACISAFKEKRGKGEKCESIRDKFIQRSVR